MKISSVTVYEGKDQCIFIKISTDEGIDGWGEIASDTKNKTVITRAKELGNKIIGCNPMEIELLWRQLYQLSSRGGCTEMAILSGIEIALWDIKGKYLNVPVYELLGGASQEKIRVCSYIRGNSQQELIENIKKQVEQGIQFIKIDISQTVQGINSFQKLEKAVAIISSLRDTFGYGLNIGIDFRGQVHKAIAKSLAKELEPFQPMFLEEVAFCNNIEGFQEVAKYVATPLATGRRFYCRWDFKHVLTSGAIDIIKPDITLTGGILETKKILAMAELFDISAAFHTPCGAIAFASALQIDACSQNIFLQEEVSSDCLDFVKNKENFQFQDGYIHFSKKPGIGVQIQEDILKNA